MKALKYLLVMLIALPAIAERTDTHTVTTDKAGTTVKTDEESSVKTTWTGATKSESEKSVVVDPKGLGNKSEAFIKQEKLVKKDGDIKEESEIKHANGTYEKNTDKTTTTKHILDDGKTTTYTHTQEVDPKGLMNKKEVETEVKIEQNPDGTTNKTVKKTVN